MIFPKLGESVTCLDGESVGMVDSSAPFGNINGFQVAWYDVMLFVLGMIGLVVNNLRAPHSSLC